MEVDESNGDEVNRKGEKATFGSRLYKFPTGFKVQNASESS